MVLTFSICMIEISCIKATWALTFYFCMIEIKCKHMVPYVFNLYDNNKIHKVHMVTIQRCDLYDRNTMHKVHMVTIQRFDLYDRNKIILQCTWALTLSICVL